MADVGTLNPTLDFVAGTVAGITGLIVGFPFDTVKVRFQSPEIAGRYSSTFNALTTIIREERLNGLYRGITSPLATVALMNGLVFASYRFFMKIQLDRPDDVPTLAQVGLAGVGSGIVSSIVTTPTELIKIRQQTMYANSTSARSVFWGILKQSGFRGLYRGFTATALRDCGYGAYFLAYEAACRFFTPQRRTDITEWDNIATNTMKDRDHLSNLLVQTMDNEANIIQQQANSKTISWPALFLAGAFAGVAGWVVTFPLDVVKTRIQASSSSPQSSPSPKLASLSSSDSVTAAEYLNRNNHLSPGTNASGTTTNCSTSSSTSGTCSNINANNAPGSASTAPHSSALQANATTPLRSAMVGHHNQWNPPSSLPHYNSTTEMPATASKPQVVSPLPPPPPRPHPYRTTLSTIMHSYRTEGFSVFFRGLTPCCTTLLQWHGRTGMNLLLLCMHTSRDSASGVEALDSRPESRWRQRRFLLLHYYAPHCEPLDEENFLRPQSLGLSEALLLFIRVSDHKGEEGLAGS